MYVHVCMCSLARVCTHVHVHTHTHTLVHDYYVRRQVKSSAVCSQCYVFAEAPSLIELALEECRRSIVKLPLLLQFPIFSFFAL